MIRREIPALLLATTVVLTGCGSGTSQTPVNSMDHCCKLPLPAGVVADSCALGSSSVNGCAGTNGFQACGGNAWIAESGEYCAGEGSVVRFPDGTRIEGPKRGSYKE